MNDSKSKVECVKALYDYNATGKKNSKGEVDISFAKGDIMKIIETRENWLLVG